MFFRFEYRPYNILSVLNSRNLNLYASITIVLPTFLSMPQVIMVVARYPVKLNRYTFICVRSTRKNAPLAFCKILINCWFFYFCLLQLSFPTDYSANVWFRMYILRHYHLVALITLTDHWISGSCFGIDRIGEDWGFYFKQYLADWISR